MVSEPIEFKDHLPIHAPPKEFHARHLKSVAGCDGRFMHQSPKSAGRDGGVLGKTHVPHRIDKIIYEPVFKDELGLQF